MKFAVARKASAEGKPCYASKELLSVSRLKHAKFAVAPASDATPLPPDDAEEPPNGAAVIEGDPTRGAPPLSI